MASPYNESRDSPAHIRHSSASSELQSRLRLSSCKTKCQQRQPQLNQAQHKVERGNHYKIYEPNRTFGAGNNICTQEMIYRAIARQSFIWYRKDKQASLQRPTVTEKNEYNRLRQLARDNPRDTHRYNWEAANMILWIKNRKPSRYWTQIDLHDLLLAEALVIVTHILERFKINLELRHHEYFTVIVGKGTHSRNGPVLGPAIQDLCKMLGYEFWGGSKVGLVIIKLQREKTLGE